MRGKLEYTICVIVGVVYEEFTHTKAVRGMQKTIEHRMRAEHGGESRRRHGTQHFWMLCRPTLDSLWYSSGPAYYRRKLKDRRSEKAMMMNL